MLQLDSYCKQGENGYTAKLVANLESVVFWIVKVHQINVQVLLCPILSVQYEAFTKHFANDFISFYKGFGNAAQHQDDAVLGILVITNLLEFLF